MSGLAQSLAGIEDHTVNGMLRLELLPSFPPPTIDHELEADREGRRNRGCQVGKNFLAISSGLAIVTAAGNAMTPSPLSLVISGLCIALIGGIGLHAVLSDSDHPFWDLICSVSVGILTPIIITVTFIAIAILFQHLSLYLS